MSSSRLMVPRPVRFPSSGGFTRIVKRWDVPTCRRGKGTTGGLDEHLGGQDSRYWGHEGCMIPLSIRSSPVGRLLAGIGDGAIVLVDGLIASTMPGIL